MGVVFVRGGLRKRKPFNFLQRVFLQAVLSHYVAACFVVGWVFPKGSCTRLGFLFGAVCVSASRAVFCGVFFCKKYCGLSFGKKKFFCGGRGSVFLHVFLIRQSVFVQNMPGGFYWWGCVLCFIQS